MRHILHFDAQQAAGAEELLILQPSQHILHRQAQLIHSKDRRIVKRDQRASRQYELPQRHHSQLANSAYVLSGYTARSEAVENGFWRTIRNQNGVEPLAPS